MFFLGVVVGAFVTLYLAPSYIENRVPAADSQAQPQGEN